jgi:hypothetical protein
METRRKYMTEAQRLAEVEKGNSGSDYKAGSDSGRDDEGPDMTPGHKARAKEEVCLLRSGFGVWGFGGLGFRPKRMYAHNQGFEICRFRVDVCSQSGVREMSV